MGYRLLCLDAGFTLLSPRPTLVDALSGVLTPDGRPITEDDLRAAWEDSDRWFWDEYHRPDNDTWTDDGRIEEYWRRYHSILLERIGVEAHAELLDRILASQFATDAWELYPDVEPMLAEVRALGDVTIGIISDWGSNLRPIVGELGLGRYLDFVLPSGAVGVAKPNPAFFRMAARPGRGGAPGGAHGRRLVPRRRARRVGRRNGRRLARPNRGDQHHARRRARADRRAHHPLARRAARDRARRAARCRAAR